MLLKRLGFSINFGQWAKTSRNFVDFFRRSWRNCFLRVHWILFSQSELFVKTENFLFFSVKEQKNVGLWWKPFRRSCQMCIIPVHEDIHWKKLSRRFFSFADLEQTNFSLSSFFSSGVVKTVLYLTVKFQKNLFLKISVIDSSYRVIDQFFHGFVAKRFQRGCENCILRVRRKTLRDKMKKPKVFNILVLWTGIFGLLSNSFRWFVKIAFYLSEGMFWRRIVSEQNISILSFSHNEQTFPTFGWNFLGGVVKTAFCLSSEKLWGDKKWKTKNFQTSRSLNGNFRTSVEFLPRVCQNCLLLVRRNVLKKNSFWTKHLYFIIFAQWANISNFWLNFFGRGCQNCILGVLNNILRKKILSLKKL